MRRRYGFALVLVSFTASCAVSSPLDHSSPKSVEELLPFGTFNNDGRLPLNLLVLRETGGSYVFHGEKRLLHTPESQTRAIVTEGTVRFGDGFMELSWVHPETEESSLFQRYDYRYDGESLRLRAGSRHRWFTLWRSDPWCDEPGDCQGQGSAGTACGSDVWSCEDNRCVASCDEEPITLVPQVLPEQLTWLLESDCGSDDCYGYADFFLYEETAELSAVRMAIQVRYGRVALWEDLSDGANARAELDDALSTEFLANLRSVELDLGDGIAQARGLDAVDPTGFEYASARLIRTCDGMTCDGSVWIVHEPTARAVYAIEIGTMQE